MIRRKSKDAGWGCMQYPRAHPLSKSPTTFHKLLGSSAAVTNVIDCKCKKIGIVSGKVITYLLIVYCQHFLVIYIYIYIYNIYIINKYIFIDKLDKTAC